jgi:MOSC domain-containing protein YiiM
MGERGEIVAVCISDRKGVPKRPVEAGVLKADWGIEGDAHAGKWHRQVSLLAQESVDKVIAAGINVRPGAFAENIVTRGLELYTLPVSTRIRLGDTLVEVTQIGKVCHDRCAIYELMGDCVMPREGIFVKVLEGGRITAGDTIEVLSEDDQEEVEGQ